LKEARREVRSQLKSGSPDQVKTKLRGANNNEINLSQTTLAHLVHLSQNVGGSTSKEINDVLMLIGVGEDKIKEVQQILKNPQLFAGDQKPANLQVLSLPPGAQKPPEFDVAPGTTVKPDERYYPYRFAMYPNESDFENGDLIYSVHEDASFIVLSVQQQTTEWQSNHHLPPMNLITRIGGSADEAPKEVLKSGPVREAKAS
jgi:hypothetical protein